jgi:hypothetical protein
VTPATLPSYKNRRGWLIAFAAVEFLIAVLLLILAAAIFLSPALQPGTTLPSPVPAADLRLFTSALYVAIAALFVVVGFGSVHCRNWARILMLVVSWFWLAVGLIALAATYVIYPVIQQGKHYSTEKDHLVFAITMLLTGVMFVLMPSVFLIFYSLKSVKATCLAMAGKPAGSSRLPPSLIAFAIFEASGGLAVLGLTSRVSFVFGAVLRGPSAFLIALVTAAASFAAAWLILRRRIAGWTLAAVKTAFWTVSTLVTFQRHSLAQLAREMGMDEQRWQDLQRFPQVQTLNWIMLAVTLVATVAFLVYTRKLFPRKD